MFIISKILLSAARVVLGDKCDKSSDWEVLTRPLSSGSIKDLSAQRYLLTRFFAAACRASQLFARPRAIQQQQRANRDAKNALLRAFPSAAFHFYVTSNIFVMQVSNQHIIPSARLVIQRCQSVKAVTTRRTNTNECCVNFATTLVSSSSSPSRKRAAFDRKSNIDFYRNLFIGHAGEGWDFQRRVVRVTVVVTVFFVREVTGSHGTLPTRGCCCPTTTTTTTTIRRRSRSSRARSTPTISGLEREGRQCEVRAAKTKAALLRRRKLIWFARAGLEMHSRCTPSFIQTHRTHQRHIGIITRRICFCARARDKIIS